MSSHIHKSCVGFEAILSDKKKKYSEKVETLLAAWEHVTSYVAKDPESTQQLIEWANGHTLNLVLRGEWPKSAAVIKTHLNVTLQRCVAWLGQQQQLVLVSRCKVLVELIQNPWTTSPALDAILHNQSSEDEEIDFCCKEKGELLAMRLKILCEDRCEDLAVNLAAACVRSLRRNELLRSLSDVTQVEYMIDVYIVLLYKLKRTHDIVAQLKLMELKDGLELMQRLSGEKPTKYGTARVWRNSMKAAELVAQYLVTTGMIRPLADVGFETLEQILNSWALLHAKSKDDDGAAMLAGIIRKLIEPAESAQHIYIFCGVLARHFGDAMKPLVIELYIRALTTDVNELENQKLKANKEKVQETAQRLSQEILKLADYVQESVGISRECVLTAFSLHPTRECYERIKQLAVACGKISCEEDSKDSKVEGAECKREIETKPATSDATLDAAAIPKKEDEEEVEDVEKKEELVPVIKDENLATQSTEVKAAVEVEVKSSPKQEALILIKGDAVTGSANYDEKAVPSQVLDGEKLGVSPQLCDDLAVVLSSQRFHVLTWWLDWKELSELCERYLDNAKEMRNTNKELKYLNIDYSQFKDRPHNYDLVDDQYLGIEKGYEQWDDSDYSESESNQQQIKSSEAKKTMNRRRSLDDTSDTDSENVTAAPKRGRPKKVQRLESSDSDTDSRLQKARMRRSLKNTICSSTESDTNTQDSQNSSLGSDGSKKSSKRMSQKNIKSIMKRRPRKIKVSVESMSKFNLLDNENIRPRDTVNGVTNGRRNDILTLFSADMDENKGSFDAAQMLIAEKRSDPTVIKSLRMFRPRGKQKLTQVNEKDTEPQIIDNGVDEKENKILDLSHEGKHGYAPMLSTVKMIPKLTLKRLDEKLLAEQQQKKQQSVVTAGDLSNELRNISKRMKNGVKRTRKTPKRRQTVSPKSNLKKSKVTDMLTKTVPGMQSMEFSVLPRVQSTVNVVQLSRNISQNSPNSANTTTASGNTPPRGSNSGNNRNSGTIQLPGTPSSTSGHDSGVGMSPAGQTPPPATRPSSLQDVGEEANPPPETSLGQDSTSISSLNVADNERPVTLAVLTNQRNSSTEQQQQIVLCKPDGTYHLVSPSIVTGQRGVLSLQNSDAKTNQTQTTRNAGLPKFQQAFGKTICTLSTESTTVPSSSAADTHEAPAAPAGAATNTQVQQHRVVTKSATASSNLTKSVQTSVQNANIPNLQVSSTRQILNIVQSAVSSSTGSNAPGQTVQLVSNSTPGVIYTHKIPVSIAGGSTPGTQLISIPAALSNTRSPVQVKLNIIRAANFRSAGGAIQLVTSRVPPQQSQAQQTATVRSAEPLINSTMEIQNQSTLEALREFESVLEQVKERDTSQSTAPDTTTVQTQTQTVVSGTKPQNQMVQQMLMQSSPSSSNSIEFPSNCNNVTFQQQQQQEVYPQKVSLMYTNQMPSASSTGASTTSTTTTKANVKANAIVASCATNSSSSSSSSATPVNVIATTYCQPAASPALSVTSQSSSSPCVTPAPATTPTLTSTVKVQPQSSSKSAKKANPKTVKVNPQVTAAASAAAAAKTATIPKTTQQKPQEDPETTQRIYAILGQYAEQLRNSPDLNNKPAPRRRSNPPTNPNQSNKRKKSGSGSKSKSSSGQTSEPSPSADDPARTMGSEDSSGGGAGSGIISGTGGSGLMHIQDSPSAGFSASEETLVSSNNNSQSGTNDNATLGNLTESRTSNATSDSNDALDVGVKRQNLIFTESNTGVAGQARAVIVQEAAMQPSSVSEALASVTSKMTTGTAVLVSEVTVKQEPPSTVLSTVAASPSNPTTTASADLDAASQYLVGGGPSSSSDSQESASSTIPSLNLESSSIDDGTKPENGVLCGNARLQEAWDPCEERKAGESSPDTTPWRYPTTCTSLEDQQLKVYAEGSAETSTHNSMLQIINKGESIEISNSGVFETKKYFHGGMNNSIVEETFQDTITKFPPIVKIAKTSPQTGSSRSTAEQENQQRIKQMQLERDLRFQKSLSEECEDLGVDEPSTSDLFPEADLQLFETNHSPSYDHSSQEAICSQSLGSIKSYGNNTTTASFFKSVDPVITSNADSRDASPVVAAPATVSTVEPKKKLPQKRTAKPKSEQTAARRKKRNLDGQQQTTDGANTAKQLKLSVVDRLALSQDEASNSNSNLSGLSVGVDSEAVVPKGAATPKAAKNGAKDRHDMPSSSGNSSSSRSIDLDTSSRIPAEEVARRIIGCNNVVSSTAVSSSGEEDENLLLEDSGANVTIPSPMSPVTTSVLLVNKYTYSNSKKRNQSVKRSIDFFSNEKSPSLSWGSPGSERTRSSSDEEIDDGDENEADESSISESFAPTSALGVKANANIGNGLETTPARTSPTVRSTPIDHATYSAKKKKTPVARRTAVNHRDSNTGLSALNKSTEPKPSSVITANLALKSSIVPAISATLTPATTTTSENESSSPVPPADKLYDINPSDDEAMATLMPASSVTSGTASPVEHCSTARRSSLRGHVKKGCGCCNGSPERPSKSKKSIAPKQTHVHQQHQQVESGAATAAAAAAAAFSVSVSASATPAKVKKTAVKHQQTKQLAKKR